MAGDGILARRLGRRNGLLQAGLDLLELHSVQGDARQASQKILLLFGDLARRDIRHGERAQGKAIGIAESDSSIESDAVGSGNERVVGEADILAGILDDHYVLTRQGMIAKAD